MSSTTPIMSASLIGQDLYGDAAGRVPTKTLGQDDFLKLLVTQLTNQDPLKPQSDLEFVSQMASFTSLEQTRAMVSDLSQLRADQEILKANSLIGRTVQINTGTDMRLLGTVTSVHMNAGKPQVVVGGQYYDLSQLQSITSPIPPA